MKIPIVVVKMVEVELPFSKTKQTSVNEEYVDNLKSVAQTVSKAKTKKPLYVAKKRAKKAAKPLFKEHEWRKRVYHVARYYESQEKVEEIRQVYLAAAALKKNPAAVSSTEVAPEVATTKIVCTQPAAAFKAAPAASTVATAPAEVSKPRQIQRVVSRKREAVMAPRAVAAPRMQLAYR